jgi:dissimilatory sulfite reductase (desulfoviridin) alpha/beta subunit
MKWTAEAERAIVKVPLFVRKRVRTRVEKEAGEKGKTVVSLADVKETQQNYLRGMESEIKGYRLERCFGASGCPNRACESGELYAKLENLLEQEKLLDFLKSRIQGPLKFHHEFSLSISDCPNACSRPQIKDVGIIGATVPLVTENECSQCGNCVEICREKAVHLSEGTVKVDTALCLACGQCIRNCPQETLTVFQKGFRVLLGGRLGRHPRLAYELPGIYSEEEVPEIVKKCISYVKEKGTEGQRFAALFQKADYKRFI